MAEYFAQFSCRLEVHTSSNVERALALCKEMHIALSAAADVGLGFHVVVDSTKVGSLLIRDPDGHGDPEHVVAFVLRCAEVLNLRGQWGFAWALSCSRPRLGGFGGGARLLDLSARKSLAWMDCQHWLSTLSDARVSFGSVT